MNILVPDISIAEKVLRSGAVYVFLLVAFRLCGKRQLGQLSAFDLVVLLLISNVVQNAVIGNDNSVGGGLIGATTILLLNAVVAYLTFRFKRSTGSSSTPPPCSSGTGGSSAPTCGGSGWARATCGRPCAITASSRCGTSATPSSRRTAT
ncbi:MAG TPA: hypothetical protein VEP12_13400 [Candidatus Acidoferrum sp.]|jgi:hypothetical protein|nr:hypothetical protein [Candidatus Acidoferrum sp.]